MDKKPTYNELLAKITELEAIVDEDRRDYLIQELRDSESRFKALSDASQEGIFIHDKGYCIEVNKVGCTMFGYEPGELIGKHASIIFTKDSWQIVRTNIQNKVEFGYDAIGLRKDGSTFNVEINGKNCLFNGQMARVTSLRDITEKVNAERALRESENKFREIFENAGDGILIGDLNGNLNEINKAFLKMTGFEKEELLGKHISTIFKEESLSLKPLQFAALDKGESIIIERYLKGKDGISIPVEMNSQRPHSNYYLSIIRDLRERHKAAELLKQKNKELIIAKEKAEESDRLKTSFLANMSHEIRTPMNGILGFAELVRAEDRDEKMRKEYLDVIVSSGHQLLDIINDVLEISRIETGQITMHFSEIHANDLLRDIHMFFQPQARQNHNDLKLCLPENSDHIRFIGDIAKIRQVLTNLIGNALKFTLNGQVMIGYSYNEEEIEFYVLDTGIGIASNFIDKVFERFLQAENSDQMKHKGTGLGLAICKRLVEMMNGQIWVKSKENEGAVFSFSIPVKVKEPI